MPDENAIARVKREAEERRERNLRKRERSMAVAASRAASRSFWLRSGGSVSSTATLRSASGTGTTSSNGAIGHARHIGDGTGRTDHTDGGQGGGGTGHTGHTGGSQGGGALGGVPEHHMLHIANGGSGGGGVGALPFTPITLVFKGLRYFVRNPSYRRGVRRHRQPEQLQQQQSQEPDDSGSVDEVCVELELLKSITGACWWGLGRGCSLVSIVRWWAG